MDRFSSKTLRELIDFGVDSPSESEQVCVSIYSPMYKAGREVQQNDVRFKNALKNARLQLNERGCDDDHIDKLLDQAESLQNDDAFWQHQSDGLAVFIGNDFFRTLRLPIRFKECVEVGDRFFVKPLVKLTTDEHQWYIFAASPKRVRLLRASMYGVDDLEPENFPQNLRDALNIDEYVSTLQFHSTSREMHSAQRQDAIHHGQGGSDPDVKKQDEILQYFHRLDDALRDYIGQDQYPLLFAGVDYLFPIFKEACKYPNLVNESVAGNPDDMTPEELHEKSKPIMQQHLQTRTAAAIDHYKEKSHSQWADFDPLAIYHAARLGQVEQLIISPGTEIPAKVDSDGSAKLVNESDNASDDLVNRIIVETLTNRGQVVVGDVDTASGLAAIFRSPANQYLDQVISGQ